MQEEFSNLNEEERLRAENDFLKMKLMLESGARFGVQGGGDLPPDIENAFLNNVIEFEKQFNQHKLIKVFDKIGRPDHFKPVAEIAEEEIDKAWKDLSDYLGMHDIYLDVCSPNISKKELYRFTIEELFLYEMEDIDVPGWSNNFIYDEFHPDPVYDNARAAEDCIGFIFHEEPQKFLYGFHHGNISLNDKKEVSDKDALSLINDFKRKYHAMKLLNCEVSSCVVNEMESIVKGTYKAEAIEASGDVTWSGEWTITLQLHEASGYWGISAAEIEGIEF